MKHLHQAYIDAVHAGPPGLFSRNDLTRLAQHVDDGRCGARVVQRFAPRSIIDIGSGGGVPGFQLAIDLPSVSVTLVESQGWKASFLRDCAHKLNLESSVEVCGVRVEELRQRTYDVGTARALAAPIVAAEYLAPLVRDGGILALWSTFAVASSVDVSACEELGLGDAQVIPAPSALRDDAVVICWPRCGAVAARFPRRVGVAAKRPLRS